MQTTNGIGGNRAADFGDPTSKNPEHERGEETEHNEDQRSKHEHNGSIDGDADPTRTGVTGSRRSRRDDQGLFQNHEESPRQPTA